MKGELIRLLHVECSASQATERAPDRHVIQLAFDAAGSAVHIDTLRVPTLADLARRLDQGPFDLLHFSGHGSLRHGLLLSSSVAGQLQAIDGPGLRGLLRDLKERCPKVCLLAFCHSLRLAREAAVFAPCAIGADGELDEGTATQFSEVFYGGLAEGRSVAAAFERAELGAGRGNALGLEVGHTDARQIRLWPRLDASDTAPPLLEEGRRLLQLQLFADASARFRALTATGGAAAHKGHYYQALALLRGRGIQGVATLTELRAMEQHVAAAACSSPQAHYYVLWAWLRRDLCERGIYAGLPPTWDALLDQATNAVRDPLCLEELARIVGIPASDPAFGRFVA